MRDRTVILVTHHITLCLSAAAYILEISRGKVARQGLVKELQALGQLQTVIQAEDAVEAKGAIDTDTAQTPENEADALCPNKDARSKISSGKLVEAEARAEGQVSLSTYLTYIRAAGWTTWIFSIVFMLLIRLIDIGNDVSTWIFCLSDADKQLILHSAFLGEVGRGL